MLVGPSKQLKQIIQTEHNIVKNPNVLAGGKPDGYLQAWPMIRTRGYREKNPGSEHESGTRT